MTIDNERLCLFEGQKWHKRSEINPDYASSADYRERLWECLVGKEEMWNSFLDWSVKQYWIKADRGFFPWLTLPLDGVPRWVSLLSEWLGLEEVREKFGTIECEDNMAAYPNCVRDNCDCSGSGKIRAEWAKEGK
jgi:hypothetical protein